MMAKTITKVAMVFGAMFLAVCTSATRARADEQTHDKSECPSAVRAAVTKAFPGGKIRSCTAEKEDGRKQFVVTVDRKGASRVELDVLPNGKIIQTEQKISLGGVPAAVMKAFAVKYPGATAKRAERQTFPNGSVRFEIAFAVDKKTREATFTADGIFVEEE
jgi:hypothetical protein